MSVRRTAVLLVLLGLAACDGRGLGTAADGGDGITLEPDLSPEFQSCDRCVEHCVCTLAGRCGMLPPKDYCADFSTFGRWIGGHIAVDGVNRILVTDSPCEQLVRVDASGRITVVAGGKTQWMGFRNLPGNSVDAAGFSGLSGISIGPKGEIYIAEAGLIRVIEGALIRVLAGTVMPGFQDGPALQAGFGRPPDLALGASGEVYVADDSRIRVVKDDQVTTLAGTREPGYVDGPAELARFGTPVGVAIVGDAMYVSDNQTIRKLEGGQVTTMAGQDKSGDLFRDGPAVDARFHGAQGLALRLGELLVADSENGRIRALDLATQTVRTVAGSGVARDGPLASAGFLYPVDVTVDHDGQIYVMDSGCIRVIRP